MKTRRLLRLLLWQWIEPDQRALPFHWYVHRDIMRNRMLTVAFPFNFIMSAYYIGRRIKWHIEGWIFKLEWVPVISQYPIYPPLGTPEEPEVRVAIDMLKRYGYVQCGHGWVRQSNHG